MGEARATGAWTETQRLASGMPQEELAGKSGLSVRAISNLGRGRTAWPHPRSLDVLAVALGLPETAGTVFAARLRAGQGADPAPGPRAAMALALLAQGDPSRIGPLRIDHESSHVAAPPRLRGRARLLSMPAAGTRLPDSHYSRSRRWHLRDIRMTPAPGSRAVRRGVVCG